MTIEKGIRLGTSTLENLEQAGRLEGALRDYDWFYLGPEFCENLLSGGVCEEAVWLQERGKKVCLLTPMLSEKGVGLLGPVFKKLSSLARRGLIDRGRFEITLNDFGALELARKNRLPFRLGAGRLLYGNFLEFNKFGNRLEIHNRLMLRSLKELGIARYEMSATGSGRTNLCKAGALCAEARGFRATLYYPYLNLTSTRTCLVGMPDIPPEESSGGVTCGRECRIGSFEMNHPWIKEKLIVRGNTVFLDFPDKFYGSKKDLLALNVDRLVYCPFP